MDSDRNRTWSVASSSERPESRTTNTTSLNSLSSSRRAAIQIRRSYGGSSGSLSSQTKKILRELESMSTPIKDAQKMPIAMRASVASSTQQMAERRAGRIMGPPTRSYTPSRPDSLSRIALLSRTTTSLPYWNNRPPTRGEESTGTVEMASVGSRSSDPSRFSGRLKTPAGTNKFSARIPELENDDRSMSSFPALPLAKSLVPDAGFLTRPRRSSMSSTGSSFTFATPLPLTRARSASSSRAGTPAQTAVKLQAEQEAMATESKPVASPVKVEASTPSASPKPELKAETSDRTGAFSANNTTFEEFKKAEKWQCSSCKFRNHFQETKCCSCLTPKPPALVNGAPVSAKTESEWTCARCQLTNDPSSLVCRCCSVEKDWKPPAKTEQTVSKWSCDVCCVSNAADATSCAACQTPRKSSVSAETTKKASWACQVCLIKNDAGKEACACCQTPRPGQKPSLGLQTNGNALNATEKEWSCTTCFVSNNSSKQNCLACNSPKPGNKFKPVSFGLGLKRPPEGEKEDPRKKMVRFNEPLASSLSGTPPVTAAPLPGVVPASTTTSASTADSSTGFQIPSPTGKSLILETKKKITVGIPLFPMPAATTTSGLQFPPASSSTVAASLFPTATTSGLQFPAAAATTASSTTTIPLFSTKTTASGLQFPSKPLFPPATTSGLQFPPATTVSSTVAAPLFSGTASGLQFPAATTVTTTPMFPTTTSALHFLPTTTASSAVAMPLFSTTTTTSSGGLQFPTATTASSTGFSFGAPKGNSFGFFGQSVPASSAVPTTTSVSAATTASSTGFSFGAATPAGVSFGFGKPPTTTTTAPTADSSSGFSMLSSTAGKSLTSEVAKTFAAAMPLFSTTTTTSGIQFPAATTASSTGFSFGAANVPMGFQFTAPSAGTGSSLFNFGGGAPAAAPAAGSGEPSSVFQFGTGGSPNPFTATSSALQNRQTKKARRRIQR